MRVVFAATFKGGRGSLTIKIRQAGKLIDKLEWDQSGRKWSELAEGKYTLSATGNSPPGGTELEIFQPTKPETPDPIPAGQITRAYTLFVEEK